MPENDHKTIWESATNFQFNLFYLVFILLLIVAVRVIVRSNQKKNAGNAKDNSPASPNAYTVALLNGRHETVKLAVLRLLEYGCLIAQSQGARLLPSGTVVDRLNGFEKEILQMVDKGSKTATILKAASNPKWFEKHYGRIREQQIAAGYMYPNNRSRLRITTLIAKFLVIAVAFVRITAMIFNSGNFNIWMTLLLAIVAIVYLQFVVDIPYLSRGGKMYVADLQVKYPSLPNTRDGEDALRQTSMVAALHGFDIFNKPGWKDLDEVFRRFRKKGNSNYDPNLDIGFDIDFG